MSSVKNESFRRKKRSTNDLPVSSSMVEVLSSKSWSYFTGVLDGSTVVVSHSGDMDLLYRMGFFGKGSLSRSNPDFDERSPDVTINFPSSEKDEKVKKKIMSKRTFLLHKEYQELRESQDQICQHGSKKKSIKANNAWSRSHLKSWGKANKFSAGEVPVKKVASTSVCVPKEIHRPLVSVLEHLSKQTSERIASYVQVPKRLTELIIDLQSGKLNNGNCNTSQNPLCVDDSVLVLDSDEEDRAEAEAAIKDRKSSDWGEYDDKAKQFWASEQNTDPAAGKDASLLKDIRSDSSNEMNRVQSHSKTDTCIPKTSEKEASSNETETEQTTKSLEHQVESEKMESHTDIETSVTEISSTSMPGVNNLTTANCISVTQALGATSCTYQQYETISNTTKVSNDNCESLDSKVVSCISQETNSYFNDNSTATPTNLTARELEVVKKLLSTSVKSTHTSFVVKSATFLYYTTTQPKFMSALLRFYSLDPVIHLDFSMDPTHLPAAFFVAENNVTYLRLFPRVEPCVLPINRITILSQRHIGLPGLSSFFQEARSNEPCMSSTKASVSSSKLHDLPIPLDQEGSTSSSDKTGTDLHDTYLSLFCVSTVPGTVVEAPQLSEIFRKILLELSSAYQISENLFLDKSSLISSFHIELTRCTASLGLSRQTEVHLLDTIFKKQKISTFSTEGTSFNSRLTPFQVYLLHCRLNYLNGESSGNLILGCKDSSIKTDGVGGFEDASKSKKRPFGDMDEKLETKKLKMSSDNEAESLTGVANQLSFCLSENSNGNTRSSDNDASFIKNNAMNQPPESRGDSKNTALVSTAHTSPDLQHPHPENSVKTVLNDDSIGPNIEGGKDLTPNTFSVNNMKPSEEICIDSSSGDEDCVLTKFSSSIHPDSIQDDETADCLVIDNTSEEDEGNYDGFEWQPCLKKDPHPIRESLHLTLEEAFFLAYGLGCLCVKEIDQSKLNLSQMWLRFQKIKGHFVSHYVAYHYFRSKGWVPKSGLKFGCDFILYRDGPPFYHSSYSVLVMAIKDKTVLANGRNSGGQLDQRLHTWADLSGVNRVIDQVAKKLMLCHVIWPDDDELNPEEFLSPKCIARFKVKEVIVSRYVPAQEREYLAGEDIP